MYCKDKTCATPQDMSSSVGTKTVKLTDDERNDNAMKIMKELIKNNYSAIIAAGIVGNMWTESKWNPTSVNKNDYGKESIGLCQWRDDRNVKLRKFAKSKGRNWQDIDVQIAYLITELTPKAFLGENRYNTFINSKTPQEAAKWFCKYWERPKECSQERMDYAYAVYEKYNNSKK